VRRLNAIMNLVRGLRRLWVVVTVCWLMYSTWSFRQHCYTARPQYSHDLFFECSWPHHYYSAVELLLSVFLVPVVLFVMGLVGLWVGRWVLRGFGTSGDPETASGRDLNVESR
jgi:hypothetical protein